MCVCGRTLHHSREVRAGSSSFRFPHAVSSVGFLLWELWSGGQFLSDGVSQNTPGFWAAESTGQSGGGRGGRGPPRPQQTHHTGCGPDHLHGAHKWLLVVWGRKLSPQRAPGHTSGCGQRSPPHKAPTPPVLANRRTSERQAALRTGGGSDRLEPEKIMTRKTELRWFCCRCRSKVKLTTHMCPGFSCL